jgi:predicted phosphodiesterase
MKKFKAIIPWVPAVCAVVIVTVCLLVGYLKINMNLDEGASIKGALYGEIAVENIDDECSLYFGDADGSALAGYTKIGVCSEGKPYKMERLVIPPEARTIVCTGGNKESDFVEIPEKYLLNADDAFVFGALSDVHYNKYTATGDDDAVVFFDNALDYFDQKNVDMVGIAGDLSNDGEESAYIKYNEAIKERSYPVFTVTGNHDINAYKKGVWEQYITANIENCVFAENGVDFYYEPEEMGGDVFVFINVTMWSYTEKAKPTISTMQIMWFEEILKQHTDDQVYLFFHLFMCGPDGQSHTGVGNIMNPGGYTYPLPLRYGNVDERVLRSVLKDYKNVIYLSGHSHWMFEMERYNEETNYSNFDGEYCHMVHIPSVTEPRWIGENDTERTGKNGVESEGWLIYDYGDTIVLLPVDFVSGTVYTEYMEIITK